MSVGSVSSAVSAAVPLAKSTPPTSTGAPATTATTDTVALSPQALALSRLQAMNAAANGTAPAAAVAATPADSAAEARFMDGVKQFLGKALGVDPSRIGSVDANDNALRYIIRNTIIGALAPPSLRQHLGIDFSGHLPKGGWTADAAGSASAGAAGSAPAADGNLAEVTLNPVEGDRDPHPLAHIAFNPAALEELARLPDKQKDRDGDGLFTEADLYSGVRALRPGAAIRGAKGFTVFDQTSATADGASSYRRSALEDGLKRTYLTTRTRDDLGVGTRTTATLAYALVQFGGYAPS